MSQKFLDENFSEKLVGLGCMVFKKCRYVFSPREKKSYLHTGCPEKNPRTGIFGVKIHWTISPNTQGNIQGVPKKIYSGIFEKNYLSQVQQDILYDVVIFPLIWEKNFICIQGVQCPCPPPPPHQKTSFSGQFVEYSRYPKTTYSLTARPHVEIISSACSAGCTIVYRTLKKKFHHTRCPKNKKLLVPTFL